VIYLYKSIMKGGYKKIMVNVYEILELSEFKIFCSNPAYTSHEQCSIVGDAQLATCI
jgi:hypothetical protein